MKLRLRILLLLTIWPTCASAGELAGQRLLVTSVRTGDTEIFEVDPDSGDARNITRSPSSEDRYPCWSPDGRQIAFTSNRAAGTYNLFVCDADGSNVRQLTHETGTSVAYMPSWAGDRIAFGLHREKPEMATIKPDGSHLEVLGAGHDPCLSPDGRKIAYTGEVTGGVSVFVMDADGSNKRQIVKGANSWGAVFPSWSPDGKRIIYSFKAGEGLELFVVDAEGATEPRQLTHLNKVCTPAAWSPDGKWISFRYTDEMYWRNKQRMDRVYAHPQADKRPVWVIRPDGSDAHVIECLHYQCAMDGSRAAWKPLAAAEPVCFNHRRSLVTSETLTQNFAAISERVSSASSHAAATRSLRSSENAFACLSWKRSGLASTAAAGVLRRAARLRGIPHYTSRSALRELGGCSGQSVASRRDSIWAGVKVREPRPMPGQRLAACSHIWRLDRFVSQNGQVRHWSGRTG